MKRLRRLWRRVGPARPGTLLLALWKLVRHPATPWYAKAVAVFVASYALSPIDLIPDFIPILGYLDDLLILAPVGFEESMRAMADDPLASLEDLSDFALRHILTEYFLNLANL